MATAVFPALAGFLFKGPFSGALAFLQPVIYSGVCRRPRANRTNPIRPATTWQRNTTSSPPLIFSWRQTGNPKSRHRGFGPVEARARVQRFRRLTRLSKFADVGFDL